MFQIFLSFFYEDSVVPLATVFITLKQAIKLTWLVGNTGQQVKYLWYLKIIKKMNEPVFHYLAASNLLAVIVEAIQIPFRGIYYCF